MSVVVQDGVLTTAQCATLLELHRAGRVSTTRTQGGRVRVDCVMPADIAATLHAAFAAHIDTVHPVGHVYVTQPGADAAVPAHRDAPERHGSHMSTHTLLVYASTLESGTGGRTFLHVGPRGARQAVEPVAGRVVLFSHHIVHSAEAVAQGAAGPKVVVVIRARARSSP
jgi:hypothetical protein